VNEEIKSAIQNDKENNDSLNNEIKQSVVDSCRITRGSYDF